MMANVPHITSGLGLKKFQADGFLLTRVYCQYERLVFFFYRLGLVDRKTWDEVHNLEQQTVRSIESGVYDEAFTVSYVDPD